MKFVPCLPVVYEMACGLKWQNSAVISANFVRLLTVNMPRKLKFESCVEGTSVI